jgi:hypothetical protein
MQEFLSKKQKIEVVSKEELFPEPVDPSKMAFEFYLDSSYLHVLDIVDDLEFHGKDYLYVKVNSKNIPLPIFIESERKRIKENLQKTFERIRYYLLVACISELGHQNTIILNRKSERNNLAKEILSYMVNSVIYKLKFKYLFSKGDSNKLENFLKNAEDLFGRIYNFPKLHYGGESWQKIANLASLMWKEREFKVDLIDRAMQLQHNTGTVFNKDKKLFDAGPLSSISFVMQRILDIKFTSRDVASFLKEMEYMDNIINFEFDLDEKGNTERLKQYQSLISALSKHIKDTPGNGLVWDSELQNSVLHLKTLIG